MNIEILALCDAATENQGKTHDEFTKARGLPGWLDKTEGNELTLTLFAADRGAGASAPLLRDVVNAHGRSLMEGRLTDIAASDQHVVKPWFGSRVPLSPPVLDLTTEGFPLVGGRADFIDGQVVPVIVYRHRLHAINVFVFAADRLPAAPLGHQQRHGFNIVGWRQGDFVLVAASDLNVADLDRLAGHISAAP